MAKKKLLNESTVRRFQRLANVKPLKEMYHMRDEDKEMMEADDMEMDLDADAEAPADDMDMDAEAPEMGGAEELELTDEEAQSIIDLGKKLEAAMGEKEEAPEADMDMDMGAEEEGEEEEMGEKEMMEALRGISYTPSKKEVVNEVAKRVAKRLAEAQKAEKRMNEALGRSTKRK